MFFQKIYKFHVVLVSFLHSLQAQARRKKRKQLGDLEPEKQRVLDISNKYVSSLSSLPPACFIEVFIDAILLISLISDQGYRQGKLPSIYHGFSEDFGVFRILLCNDQLLWSSSRGWLSANLSG